MLSRVKGFLAPPEFPDDNEKTRLAKALSTLLLSAIAFLFFFLCIAIPFIFTEKLIDASLVLVLMGLMAWAYLLIKRGRVRLASTLFVAGIWLVFTLFLPLAGGITSVAIVFYLVGIVIAGLLLGTRGAIIYLAACCLAGLGMVLLDSSGHAFERVFPISPFVGWLDMSIALASILIVLRLVLQNLQSALALTQHHLKERDQIEQALRESEERFSSLSSAASEGIGISDQDKIIDANPQLAIMMGYEPGELVGMSAMDLVAPQSRDMVNENTSTGFEGLYEFMAIKKDGTIFPVEIRASMIHYKGNPARVAVIQDVTERKHTEENLSRQVERLRALHTIEQAIVSSMDLKTVLELLVREIVSQLQVDAASVLLLNPQKQTLDFAAGKGFHTKALKFTSLDIGSGLAGRAAQERNIVHVTNLAEMDSNPNLVRSIANEGFVSYFGIPLIAKTQLRGVLEIFHRSMLAPDPGWLRFLETIAGQAAISIDNARLLEMTQESLKETNALYRINQDMASAMDSQELMENVVNLLQKNFGYYYVQIFVIQPETGDFIMRAGSGSIGDELRSQGYHLAAGEGIIGYTAETGKAFFTNNVDEMISFVRAPLLPDTKSELAVPIRTGIRTLGLLDIHQAPPATLTEEDLQLVSAVADQLAIALQKAQLYADLQNSLLQEQATRSQLIHSEKLATAGRLLASVSHELNNPLQAIQNALFLLKDEAGLSQQGRQDLRIVLAEAERMATLLERLRTTYQPVQPADFELVQINTIIEDVQALIATHLRHASVSFVFHPEPVLPAIAGLCDQLKQVLLNLFMNAVDAMEGGGQLTVSTAWEAKHSEVLIKVSDTGTGIDESILPNIFEAFTTGKEKGTGLGLAISYEIIQMHNGRIRAQNVPGGGAEFSIWLPVKPGGLQ